MRHRNHPVLHDLGDAVLAVDELAQRILVLNVERRFELHQIVAADEPYEPGAVDDWQVMDVLIGHLL